MNWLGLTGALKWLMIRSGSSAILATGLLVATSPGKVVPSACIGMSGTLSPEHLNIQILVIHSAHVGVSSVGVARSDRLISVAY
jgi:hypothetical protein